jgi:hypothetical protein
MKNRHNHNIELTDDEYYDDDYMKRGKKKESPRRRETRNWKKAWNRHHDEYDEMDDFYVRK